MAAALGAAGLAVTILCRAGPLQQAAAYLAPQVAGLVWAAGRNLSRRGR